MRRKGAIERRIDRLEDAEHLLLNLMEILKKDDRNMRVSQLINLVRSNASLDEIHVFLERQFSQEDLERLPQVVETQNHLARMPKDETCARPGRRMMGIHRLADIPIYRVPAKPWTTMTDDDDLVSHLISIWLTWSHPWFHWVNGDLFLRDMRAGKVDCEFCSPFLVNAILAEASVCKQGTSFPSPSAVQKEKPEISWIETNGCIWCIAALFRLFRSIYGPRRHDGSRHPFPRRSAAIT